MKKMTTVLAAMLLALSMMAMPAMADDEGKTLEQLQEELAAAEREVERLDGEVLRLDGEIEDKQAEVDAQQTVVDDLKDDLAKAEADLTAAKAERDRLQALYDACNPETSGKDNGNGCRNEYLTPGGSGPLADAREDVTEKQSVVDGIEEELEAAEEALGDLQGELSDLQTELGLTNEQLAAAEQAVIDAQAALDAYAAAPAHPGCTGINNAKANVAKNVPAKSNANTALAAVSTKLGCNA